MTVFRPVLLLAAVATFLVMPGCGPSGTEASPSDVYGKDTVSLRTDVGAAFDTFFAGNADGALAQFARILDSAQGPALARQRLIVLNAVGRIQQDLGAFDTAQACYEEGLRIATLYADSSKMSGMELNLSALKDLQSDYSGALVHALRALELEETRHSTDTIRVAGILNNLSALHYRQNNYAESERLLRRSVAFKEQQGDTNGWADGLSSWGLLRMEAGDLDSAVTLFRQSIELKRLQPHGEGLSGKYSNLALAYMELGKPDSALVLNKLGLDDARQFRNPVAEIKALYGMAESLMALGRSAEAGPLLNTCMAIAQAIGAPEEVKETYLSMGRRAEKMGDYKTALAHHTRHHELSDSLMNAEKDATMQDLRMKYRTEKKDRENEELRAAQEVTALRAARNRWIAMGAGVLALAIGVVSWLLYQRARQRAEQQVADLEQQALRLQMDPHFLFNALNTIPGLYSTGDTARANDHVGHLSKFLRLVLETSRRRSIPLQQELELTENYLRICADRRSDAFTWDIHVAPDIHPDRLLIPPMLLQPLVENALAHGLAGVESGGHVDVRVEREQDLVRITVHDNGVGRRVAAERRIHRPGASMGMDLVRKRLAIHDKARRADSVQVIDEVRTDGTPRGTSVVLRMGIHDIRQHA